MVCIRALFEDKHAKYGPFKPMEKLGVLRLMEGQRQAGNGLSIKIAGQFPGDMKVMSPMGLHRGFVDTH